MTERDHVETEHVRFKVLSASEEIAGKRTVMIYATSEGGTHVFELSPMQAIHLATNLLCAVKELKLFEENTDAVICEAIRTTAFRFQSELELQDGIAARLGSRPEQREVILGPKDRIDFLLDGVGIEVKTDGSLPQVIRQLHHYAQFEAIQSLILVTNRARHRTCPERMNGKPVTTLFIGGAL